MAPGSRDSIIREVKDVTQISRWFLVRVCVYVCARVLKLCIVGFLLLTKIYYF